jgi:hypothetical protein
MKMQKISMVWMAGLFVFAWSGHVQAQNTFDGPVTIQDTSVSTLNLNKLSQPNDPTTQRWSVNGDKFGFQIRNNSLQRDPVSIKVSSLSSSLVTDGNGIGIGTFFPAAQLHVYGNDDVFSFPDPKLLIENDSYTTLARTLVELKNNGGCQILMRNTNNNNNLTLTQNNVGSFFFQSRVGGSKTTFLLKPNSQVFTIQRDDVNLMQSRSNGDLWIAGALVGPSDRAMKADFADVDRQQVLQKLVEMPITTWRYKTDEEIRHIGPMAQDFRAAFSLGADDKTIYPIDSIGISLVAIQALHQQVQEKDQQIAELQAQLAEQKSELEKQQSELAKQTDVIQQQQKFSATLADRLDQLEFNTKQTVLTSAD